MTEDREEQLDQIIADFLQSQESGRTVSEQEVIAAHPELAEELREFFDDLGQMNELAAPVVSQQPVLEKIRYFGDYELLEEIARGGMGIVYKARQTSLNRVVAVKLILSGHLASETDVKRFQTEAESAANLQHPQIVSVFEVGRHKGQSYFSMEYIDGKNLSEIVRDRPLPPKQAAGYVWEVAEAIHYAHQQGTLHRDLKPSNVLIDQNDRVQITDFGLAMKVEGDSELTRTGQVLGTPSYMPPEQAQHKRGLIGPGSDIYSIGAILYELLTGRPPFQADSAVETLRQVIETEPLSPRLLNPAVPKDLETICLKCLQKEPHKRYATAQHLADDLGRFLQGEPILARPVGRVERAWRWCRRKPAVAGSVTSLGIAIMAIMGLAIDRTYREKLESAYSELTEAHAELETTNTELEDTNRKLEDTNLILEGSNNELGGLNSRLRDEGEKTFAALDRAESLSYLLHISSARHAWMSYDVKRAEMLLDSCDESKRLFEWYYLKSLCHGEIQTMSLDQEIQDFSVSSDGTWIAVLTSGKQLLILTKTKDDSYQPASGLPLMSDVGSVEFLPESHNLFVGRGDGLIELLSLSNGEVLETLSLRETQPEEISASITSVSQIQISADKWTRAALVHFDGQPNWTVVWKQGAPESVRWINQKAEQIALSSDGSFLVQAVTIVKRERGSKEVRRSNEKIVVWDTNSHEPVGLFPFASGISEVLSMQFVNNGTTLLTGHADSSLRMWDFDLQHNIFSETARQPWILRSHEGEILDLAQMTDGRIISAGSDSTIQIWNHQELGEQKRLLGHQDAVTFISAINDGRTIISAGRDRTIRIWNTDRTPGSKSLSSSRNGRGLAVQFTLQGRQLGCFCPPSISFVDLDSPLDVTQIKWRGVSSGRSLAVAPDGSRLVVGGMSNSLNIYRTSDLKEITHFSVNRRGRFSSRVAFSPDNDHVAVATKEGISVWKLSESGPPDVFPLNHAGMISDVTFSPDGESIAYALGFLGNDRLAVILYDRSTHEIQAEYEIPNLKKSSGALSTGIHDLDFSPDGSLLAAAIGHSMGTEPGEVVVWDVHTQTQIFRLPSRRYGVYSVAFSPDGSRLASGGGRWDPKPEARDEAELILWDMKYGQEIISLDGHDTAIISVDFSPDGKVLASASWDRTIRIWGDVYKRSQNEVEITTHEWTQKASEMLKRGDVILKITQHRNRFRENPASMFDAYQLATLLRYAGDFRGYRAVCNDLLDEFSKPNSKTSRHVLLMTFLLFPEGEVSPEILEIAKQHGEGSSLISQRMLGIAYYRLQQDEKALALLERAASGNSTPHSKLVTLLSMALVQLRLGHLDSARSTISGAYELHQNSHEYDDSPDRQPWGIIPSLWREVQQAMETAGVDEPIPELPPLYATLSIDESGLIPHQPSRTE